ncbi:MAG: hypothetical protein R3B54_00855 [Bdellovibrionota bacterium]
MLWRKHPQGGFFTQHVAIYLGGDFIYHKFGPDPRAAYEIITAESFFNYYKTGMALAARGASSDPSFGWDFHFEYLRYAKELSPAQKRAVQSSIQTHSARTAQPQRALLRVAHSNGWDATHRPMRKWRQVQALLRS